MQSYKWFHVSLCDGVIVSLQNGTSLLRLVIIYRHPDNWCTNFLVSFYLYF